MIGHQTPGVDPNAVDILEGCQGFEVSLEVTNFSEYHLPVMPTLDDVVGVVRQDSSSHSRHGDSLREFEAL